MQKRVTEGSAWECEAIGEDLYSEWRHNKKQRGKKKVKLKVVLCVVMAWKRQNVATLQREGIRCDVKMIVIINLIM